MSYLVLFQPHLKRDMSRLPGAVRERVDRKIQALAEDPRPRGSIKMTGVGNAYRIRIGDWRIIYEIDDTAQTVVVTVVAHRREAYR